MAVTIADLQVKVGADTKSAEANLRNLHARINSVAGMPVRALGGLHSQISGITRGLSGAGVAATGFIAAFAGYNVISSALDTAKSAIFGFNAGLEQSTIAWGTLLQSQEAANYMMREFQAFAARTPFGFEDVEKGARRLVAMGFAARDVIDLMTDIGNASAALGAGAQGVDRIVTALGQMQAKAKVQAQEMNQLAEMGIPAWAMLAQAMGKPIPVVMKLAEQGEISSQVLIDAFRRTSKEKWGDMMERQSRTGMGAISALSDLVQFKLANAFRPLYDRARDAMLNLVDVVEKGKDFEAMATKLSNAVTNIINGLTQMDPAVWGAAGAFAATATALAILAPLLMWLTSPIALLGMMVGTLYYAWSTNWNGIRDTVSSVVSTIGGHVNTLRQFLVSNLSTIVWGSIAAFTVWAMVVGVQTVNAARQAAVALAGLVVQHVRTAAAAALSSARQVAMAVTAIPGLVAAIPGLVAGLARLAAHYALVGAAAMASAVRQAAAWLMVVLPAVLGAIGAIIAPIAPFLLVLAAIATTMAAVAYGWDMTWADMSGIPGKVLQWVGQKIVDFINKLKGLPLIGQFVQGVGDAFGSLGEGIKTTVNDWSAKATEAANSINGAINDVKSALSGDLDLGNWQAALDELTKNAENEAGIAAKLAEEERKAKEALDANAAAIADAANAAGDLGDALGGAAGGAGKAAEAAEEATVNVQELIKAMVALHPATQAATAAVTYWQQQVEATRGAIEANNAAVKAAQDRLSGMRDALGVLNERLSETRERFQELSNPRLLGMGQAEDEIHAVEMQLKRLQYAAATGMTLGQVRGMFPQMAAGLEAFVSGLPDTEEGLRAVLDQMKLAQSLKFDDQLRQLKQAAEGPRREMGFGDAMSQLVATRSQISELTAAVRAQEGAIKAQEQSVAAMQKAGEALQAQQEMNNKQLEIARQNYDLVVQALQDAYTWMYTDRAEMMKAGPAGEQAAAKVDAKTRELLGGLSEFAQTNTATNQQQVDTMVAAYNKAVDEIKATLATIPKEFDITVRVNSSELSPSVANASAGGGGGGGGATVINNINNTTVQGSVVSERELHERARASNRQYAVANAGVAL